MAKKEVVRIAKLEFNAGQAKPGPELAGLGIVMPEFTKQFNDATRERGSEPVPVTITVYNDKSFDFKTHTSPTAYKLKDIAKIKSGSKNAKTEKVATISMEDVKKIAEYKLPDLNTDSIESAIRTVVGTAKNMGILVEGYMDIAAETKAAKDAAKAEALAAVKEAKLQSDIAENKESKDKVVEVETIAQGKEENAEEGEN